MHGRVEGAQSHCAIPGCTNPGEFKAPLRPADFDGPGSWRFLCLDHVREHNAEYNFFDGMSPEEIQVAQGPLGGWARPSRAFAHVGADAPPAWRDFTDPLDAISARFRPEARRRAIDHFTARERHALGAMGLSDESDLHEVRRRYSELVRRYHPDRNGGDRSHEKKLGAVIEAWQILRVAKAFA